MENKPFDVAQGKPDPRLHIVTVTGIIEREGKYLILKRSEREVAYPGAWTVPGGKLVRHEYEHLPKTEGTHHWYDIVPATLAKEIAEECGLTVKDFSYLTDMTFIRPDDVPVLVLSYWCRYAGGEVKLGKDMTDSAWITPDEGKNYELIPGILDEIRAVDCIVNGK
ncbi:MAG: NUDIX domain-containing protein [bacterium]|nr:NUDIX domain-containing protein [bacterium]